MTQEKLNQLENKKFELLLKINQLTLNLDILIADLKILQKQIDKMNEREN